MARPGDSDAAAERAAATPPNAAPRNQRSATHRKPRSASRWSGDHAFRLAARGPTKKLQQEPPFTTRRSALPTRAEARPARSFTAPFAPAGRTAPSGAVPRDRRTRSLWCDRRRVVVVAVGHPLPDIAAQIQHAVGAGPVGVLPDRDRMTRVAGRRRGLRRRSSPSWRVRTSTSSPQGYSRPSVPRAAFSHSASVGRRPPAKRQKACASAQVTFATGRRSSRLASAAGGRSPGPAGSGAPADAAAVVGARHLRAIDAESRHHLSSCRPLVLVAMSRALNERPGGNSDAIGREPGRDAARRARAAAQRRARAEITGSRGRSGSRAVEHVQFFGARQRLYRRLALQRRRARPLALDVHHRRPAAAVACSARHGRRCGPRPAASTSVLIPV